VDDKEKRAREAVQRALKNAPWVFSKEGNRQFFRAHWERMDPEQLIALARDGDNDALAILMTYARGARKAGIKVPNAFHELVWEYFLDELPGAAPGPSPKDSELRKVGIRILVKIVMEYGFNATRNPEHRGRKDGPMTACRIVAEEIGLQQRTVEDIWEERGPSLRTG
jgi:hypothetical protein